MITGLANGVVRGVLFPFWKRETSPSTGEVAKTCFGGWGWKGEKYFALSLSMRTEDLRHMGELFGFFFAGKRAPPTAALREVVRVIWKLGSRLRGNDSAYFDWAKISSKPKKETATSDLSRTRIYTMLILLKSASAVCWKILFAWLKSTALLGANHSLKTSKADGMKSNIGYKMK